MRKLIIAAATMTLAGCSTTPRPLVPDTDQGPTSYVCYSSLSSTADEIRLIAERQCARSNLGVSNLIGQSWTPLRCGLLTPTVAAFQCGGGSNMGLAPLPPQLSPTP